MTPPQLDCERMKLFFRESKDRFLLMNVTDWTLQEAGQPDLIVWLWTKRKPLRKFIKKPASAKKRFILIHSLAIKSLQNTITSNAAIAAVRVAVIVLIRR